ncbi:hypothetical protein PG993_002974 [Apiospora rasikravindrae]|uniref:Acyltransferase 3 domain-containing protein n=1 Tax=Apiospora rasikravindrae TaxID=990691 RepID=A0ABR1U0V7_9PEZI
MSSPISPSPQPADYHQLAVSSNSSPDDGHSKEAETLLVEAELRESGDSLPTSPPNGLRGYAAFFVVWHHISLVWFSWDLHGGYAGSEMGYFLQLPIIRLAISGPPHVFVFFVISGYALSHKTLKLLRQGGKTEEAYATLASSAFRRHPRLFIPPEEGGGRMPRGAVKLMGPAPLATLGAQFGDYVRTTLEMIDPLGHRNDWTWIYNPALWTLPHEFRGSLLVYGALLALSRCKSSVRLLVTTGMAFWALYFVYWPEFLFLSGMLLADLRLHTRHHTQGQKGEDDEASSTLDVEWKPAITSRSSGWKSVIPTGWSNQYVHTTVQTVMYIFILYVLGAPEWRLGGAEAPGYVWLAQLVPSQYIAADRPSHFWPTIAAVALIFALDRSPLLQRLFTTPFARYLGRISYSLYLVHVPILHGLGYWAGKFFLETTGSETDSGYVLGVTAAAVVVWVVTIWAADLGWRYVDAPAVRFAGWVYRKVAVGR